MRGRRRARDPSRSTSASAASTARRRAPSSRRWSSELEAGARDRASRPWLGRATLPFPDFEEDYELVALRDAGRATRSSAGGSSRARGLDIAPSAVRRALRRGARRALDRAALAAARAAARYLVGPLARYALNRDRLSPARARGGRRGRASSRCAATRSAASSCAPSRSSTRSTRRCALHRRLRAAGSARRRGRRRARASATAGPRRRAACSATATRSTTTARSSTRGSCRRPRRTRAAIEQTCAASSSATSTCPTTSCTLRCEQAIRNYDPCISCATHFLRLEVDRA